MVSGWLRKLMKVRLLVRIVLLLITKNEIRYDNCLKVPRPLSRIMR
jgi:hypothetical protein